MDNFNEAIHLVYSEDLYDKVQKIPIQINFAWKNYYHSRSGNCMRERVLRITLYVIHT